MGVADFPLFFTDEDVNTTMMTNAIATDIEKPFNPLKPASTVQL